MKNQVSIITPCYQQGEFLAQAADSVLAQTCQDFEWIIVNDGSTDTTREVAAGLVRQAPGKIKFIEQENRGQALARQVGFEAAQGEFVVMLDADDLLEPSMLAVCQGALTRNPGAAAVVGNVLLTREDGRSVIREFTQNRIVGWPEVLEYNPYGAVVGVMTCAAAIRRVGGLAVAGTAGCEDWDLWARLTRCGMEFIAVDTILGRYRQPAQSYGRRAGAMLEAAIGLLDAARTNDPRLRGEGLRPAAPIGEALYQRLRNGRVFNSLGLAVAGQATGAQIETVLEFLVSGEFDAELCIRQFTWGLQFGLLPRADAAAEPIALALLLDPLARRLEAIKADRFCNEISKGLTRAARRAGRSGSLVARLINRAASAVTHPGWRRR